MLSKTKNWPVLFAQWKKISVIADVSNTCYYVTVRTAKVLVSSKQ